MAGKHVNSTSGMYVLWYRYLKGGTTSVYVFKGSTCPCCPPLASAAYAPGLQAASLGTVIFPAHKKLKKARQHAAHSITTSGPDVTWPVYV